MSRRTLTIPEACQRLRLSYGRVWRLVMLGEIRGGQENGRWWVDWKDLARYESEHQHPKSVSA